MSDGPTLLIDREIDWDDVMRSAPAGAAPPAALVAEARRAGARRKKVARGEGGFFMNRSVLPAGFRVPRHKHNHNELMIVVRGGCIFDDGLGELGPDDSIVILADYRYGFTVGEAGIEFLTIRTGEASVELE